MRLIIRGFKDKGKMLVMKALEERNIKNWRKDGNVRIEENKNDKKCYRDGEERFKLT